MRLLGILPALLVALLVQGKALADDKPDLNRPVRDKWALIVGISNFADKKIPHLKYSTKDARDFYNYLIKEGNFAPDHVRLLLDEKATQRRIMSELGSKFLARMAKPDDLVVLFFSTHGSPGQMDIRGKNYIVAYDSDPSDLFASGIEMQKIMDSIQGRVLTDRVLLVMDACHSGGVDPNAKGIVRSGNFDAAALAEGSGQLVICSSQTEEQSWESKRYENGVFTHNLLEGLRSSPDKGLAKAFSKTQELVRDEVQEDYPGARQTPVLVNKWAGNDLIIAVKPQAPQQVPQTVVLDLEPDSSATPPSPIRDSQMSEAPKSNVTTEVVDQAPQSLTITSTYFSNEKDPRIAYQEACAQQAAHFNEPAYYFRKAAILIQMGNYSKAEQELKGLLVDIPNNSDYHLARAYCYYRMGNKFAAEDELNMAKFHNPSLPKDIKFGN